MKNDKETTKVLTDAEKIKNVTDSEAWKLMMHMLNDILASNDSLTDIIGEDKDKMFQEIAARQLAIKMVKDWVDDISGVVNTYKSYREIIYREDEEGLIRVDD